MAISAKSKIAPQRDNLAPSVNDVESEIEKKLHFSNYAGLRHISYDIDGDTVVLYGRVPSYYLKQMAQVNVTCVPGIERVDNRIEVAVT